MDGVHDWIRQSKANGRTDSKGITMATANDILAEARKYIGVKESPANSNNVIFNTHFYGRNVNGAAYPWCCAFVWDVFRMVGASKQFCGGLKTAYCPAVESYAAAHGRKIDFSEAKAGDIVLFCFSKKNVAEHIGIVEKWNADGTINCIEGNTSVTSNDNGGSVMRRTRSRSVVRSIYRPEYDQDKKEYDTKPKWVAECVASTLNIRTGPGTEYPNLPQWGMIAKGNWVDVCDEEKAADDSTWFYVRIQGMYWGWAAGRYLKKVC